MAHVIRTQKQKHDINFYTCNPVFGRANHTAYIYIHMSSIKFFETCMPDLSYHLQLDAMHALGKSHPHSFTILHAIRPIITHVRI